jgi:hypothetical protein
MCTDILFSLGFQANPPPTQAQLRDGRYRNPGAGMNNGRDSVDFSKNAQTKYRGDLSIVPSKFVIHDDIEAQ